MTPARKTDVPIFAFIAVLAVVSAIFFGVAFTTRLFARLDRLEDGRGTGALASEVERLRLEVGDLQTELERVTERLDFTEQLLRAPRGSAGELGSGTSAAAADDVDPESGPTV